MNSPSQLVKSIHSQIHCRSDCQSKTHSKQPSKKSIPSKYLFQYICLTRKSPRHCMCWTCSNDPGADKSQSEPISDYFYRLAVMGGLYRLYILGTDPGPGTWQEKVELKTHFFKKQMKFIHHNFSYHIAHHAQSKCESTAGKGMEPNQEQQSRQ